ncbi:MAG: 4Fe-4S dicluster domain-containing protein [Planctomycetota bacterium]
MIDDNSTAAILTDTTLCTGCEACVAACKKENDLGKDRMRRWKRKIDDLSSTRFTTIIRRPGGHSVRQQCRHCKDPACVSACLVGALQKTDEGPVIYDADKCMGCRYCMMACPYGIPRYDWDKPVPYVRKCTMCYSRIQEGRQPACTEACPEGATIFGTRAEMLAVAHRRIKDNPGKYLNRVFGEHEVGGTSVFYISDIPLGFLGWKPDMGNEPLPTLTWASLTKVPPVIAGMAVAMSGIYFIIGRRMKFQAQAAFEQEMAAAAAAASSTTQAPQEGEASGKAEPSADVPTSDDDKASGNAAPSARTENKNE